MFAGIRSTWRASALWRALVGFVGVGLLLAFVQRGAADPLLLLGGVFRVAPYLDGGTADLFAKGSLWHVLHVLLRVPVDGLMVLLPLWLWLYGAAGETAAGFARLLHRFRWPLLAWAGLRLGLAVAAWVWAPSWDDDSSFVVVSALYGWHFASFLAVWGLLVYVWLIPAGARVWVRWAAGLGLGGVALVLAFAGYWGVVIGVAALGYGG